MSNARPFTPATARSARRRAKARMFRGPMGALRLSRMHVGHQGKRDPAPWETGSSDRKRTPALYEAEAAHRAMYL